MTSPKDQRLARLVACIALGRCVALGELRQGAPESEPDREWREAFLMTHLFAGFPRAVEAALVLARAGGLGEPDSQEQEEVQAPLAAGQALFQTVYAEQTGAVTSALRGAHPLLESWILGHAYGRVLSRPGISPARRELLAIAALAALGQERQLGSHVRGALRCGAEPLQIIGILDSIADLVDPGDLQRAKRLVSDVCSL